MRDEKGRFAAGNTFGKGRPPKALNELNRRFHERVKQLSDAGDFQIGDFLIEVVRDEGMPLDLRYKADAKLADLIYGNRSHAVIEDETERMSEAEINQRIKDLVGAVL